MNKQKIIKIIMFIFFSYCLSLILKQSIVYAGNSAKIENGQIVFRTKDTIATSGTRWTTVGFTIRREATFGNPVLDNKYAVITMKEQYKSQIANSDGTYDVTYTIPSSVVNAALSSAGFWEIRENETLYLNSIFQVKENGTLLSTKYYTLNAIRNARPWKNPNDFVEHFDIEVIYHGEKHPVEICYQTLKGDVIAIKQMQKQETGKVVSLTLQKSRVYQGETYHLYRSYLIDKKDFEVKRLIKTVGESSLSQVQNRSGTVKIGGIRFVAVMKKEKEEEDSPEPPKPPKPSEPPESSVTKICNGFDLEQLDAYGIIKAMERGEEQFDVMEGIPTTEWVYTNVFCPSYLISYCFENVSGEKRYPITITKTYELHWTETTTRQEWNGKEFISVSVALPKSQSITVTKDYMISRNYSYWTISELNYYIPVKSYIENSILPKGSITMEASDTNIPKLIYKVSSKKEDHIQEPVYKRMVHLGTQFVYGGSQCPSVPEENFQDQAEENIGKIIVQNDQLLFHNTIIMEQVKMEEKTNPPIEIPRGDTYVEKNYFYKTNLQIPANHQNGIFDSRGSVTYKQIESVSSALPKELTYSLFDVNEVVVHTPVICYPLLQNNMAYCQLVLPNLMRKQLVLDTSFFVQLPTKGQHNNQLGYGYRDYETYIAAQQVKFPFDVYKGEYYYQKNTWISIAEKTQFYLPIWVEEGEYEVQFRTISINAKGQEQLQKEEEGYNRNYENYVAKKSVFVEVSGRLYGLQVYDIADYPLWREVFRKPDSLEKTGISYLVGIYNQNGIKKMINSKFTLPLLANSHPNYKEAGILKPGYTMRFSLKTIGQFTSDTDSICITPTFYYIDKNQNRIEADVYYEETINGKYETLVKVGDELDKKNEKKLSLTSPYLSVEKQEVISTIIAKELSLETLKKERVIQKGYEKIEIPSILQTTVGSNYHILKKKQIPNNISVEQVSLAKQNWYFEYTLPAKLYVTKKGFHLDEYTKNRGKKIDFQEEFWLKEGVLLVSFDIIAKKNKVPYLSYQNEYNYKTGGFCNMWKMEGFQKKKEVSGAEWILREGDIAVFSLKKGAAADYQAGGTH